MKRRSAFTLIEIVFGVALLVLILAAAGYVFGFSTRSTGRLSGSLSLHQGGRKAVVRLLAELQEGMEVLAPRPGGTLPYALVRDKLSVVRWFYLIPQAGKPGRYELWRFAKDAALPPAQRAEKLLSEVKRLTFTARSEGALQMNLTLAEDEQEYAVLTTVRLRNLAAAEELW